jgi:RNA polymerase sigma factor (TIGR02999 family)
MTRHWKEAATMTSTPQEVSQLLRAWSEGDQTALDKLMPLVYEELRRMAKRHMDRQNPGHTLQTTALIHEAYLRLVDQKETRWQNRAHFFAVAAQAMRHILVDYARSRHAAKRGGAAVAVSLDEAAVASEAAVTSDERAAEMVALDDALESLAAIDRRKCQVVELRYFGGLSVEETAEVLKVSRETVARDWRLARTWLLRELSR